MFKIEAALRHGLRRDDMASDVTLNDLGDTKFHCELSLLASFFASPRAERLQVPGDLASSSVSGLGKAGLTVVRMQAIQIL